MIKKILGSFLINLFALYFASQIVSGFVLEKEWNTLLILCAGFTFLHLFLRPVLNLIFRPLNFLTLGFVGLIIDAAILYGLTLYFPQVRIVAWVFPGIQFDGLTVPTRSLGVIEVTVFSSFLINLIRSTLSAIFF